MNYNFKCKCSLCSSTNDERDNWIGEKSRRSDVLDFAERFAVRAHAENDVKQEIALLHECLRLRASCCHSYDRLILKTRNALMSACLSQGDYKQARCIVKSWFRWPQKSIINASNDSITNEYTG